MADPREGVNIFGYFTSRQSQGVIARNLVEVLRASGVPVALTDVRPDYGGTGEDTSCCEAGRDDASALPYPLTIFCFVPDAAEEFIRRNPHVVRKDRFTAVIEFVEHQRIRAEHLPVLRVIDLVLTPTDFVSSAVRNAVPSAVCVPFKQAVLHANARGLSRERLGITADKVLFVNAFDSFSDSTRKNPVAIIEAFQEAFPGRDDVALLLKIGHLDADAALGGEAVRAAALARDDERISILEANLPYTEVLGLFAAADVVVSLHRSEGLGLTLMEAMTMGTPVVATNYSGNLDFMDATNSSLVDCELIPVSTNYPPYRQLVGKDVWAEPNRADASRKLRALADSRMLRAEKRAAGLASMAARVEEVMGGQLAEALRDVTAQPSVAQAHYRRRLGLLWLAHKPLSRADFGATRHRLAVRVKSLARKVSNVKGRLAR